MTQEEKDLLLKDLCARLPYGVKVQYLTGGNDKTYVCNVDQVSIKSQCVGIAEIGHTVFTWRTIGRIKPYLRPISSITEEEDKNRIKLGIWRNSNIEGCKVTAIDKNVDKALDWLNANHFDYRGLIPMGLAIEVTEDNNPYRE